MKVISLSKPGVEKIQLTEPGEYVVELLKDGVEAEISGIFQAVAKENTVLKIIIHHKAPNTQAKTVLKGVARDAARISFTGRIIIDPECGNSNSFLTERILLLSDEAKAEAVPDLEILTDDVKCSHAASISRIPESQLFYLMSRGVSRPEAEKLIVDGFLGR